MWFKITLKNLALNDKQKQTYTKVKLKTWKESAINI